MEKEIVRCDICGEQATTITRDIIEHSLGYSKSINKKGIYRFCINCFSLLNKYKANFNIINQRITQMIDDILKDWKEESLGIKNEK